MLLRERKKCTLAGPHAIRGWQLKLPLQGWVVPASGRTVPQLRSVYPPQVEFTPQTLQQKPPNGWFRLLPFPRAEDSG